MKLSYDDSTVQRVARAICKEFEGCDGCPGRERCGNQWKAGPEGEHAGLVYDDEMERLARAALAALAQPAQPLPKCPNCAADTELILRCPNCGINGPKFQQAQPEMPTLEAIAKAIWAEDRPAWSRGLAWTSEAEAIRDVYRARGRAVLALFAPKSPNAEDLYVRNPLGTLDGDFK